MENESLRLSCCITGAVELRDLSATRFAYASSTSVVCDKGVPYVSKAWGEKEKESSRRGRSFTRRYARGMDFVNARSLSLCEALLPLPSCSSAHN